VDVRPLNADVDDAERALGLEVELAKRHGDRGRAHRSIHVPSTQAANFAIHAQHDVKR
jgi:hypothetical protein